MKIPLAVSLKFDLFANEILFPMQINDEMISQFKIRNEPDPKTILGKSVQFIYTVV